MLQKGKGCDLSGNRGGARGDGNGFPGIEIPFGEKTHGNSLGFTRRQGFQARLGQLLFHDAALTQGVEKILVSVYFNGFM